MSYGITKIVSPESIAAYAEGLRGRGETIVFTNGVFDLLHPGHVRYLADASRLGTHLIVALNSDLSARKIKGEKRPLVSYEQRAELLAGFEFVDAVTCFDEETPEQIIQKIRPHVLVKGADWQLSEIVGKDFVESYGGKVVRIDYLPGYSTSAMIAKILQLPDSRN